MRILLLGALALSLLNSTLFAQGRRADEIARYLAQLGDPSVELRDAAEHWLGAELSRGDGALVAAAVGAGGPEVGRRLSGLLARDARLVSLAADLLADANPKLARVGEEALRGLAGRYFPMDAEGPTTGLELRQQFAMVANLEAPWSLAIDPTQPLEVLVEHLIRARSLPFALVIEPGTSARSDRPKGAAAEAMIGSWEKVLAYFSNSRGVALEGHGLPLERSSGLSRSALVRVGTTGESFGLRPADLALGWVRAAQKTHPRLHRQGLRALASSRWPAGLLLVEEFYFAGDPVALEALLLAAADGRRLSLLRESSLLGELLRKTAADMAQANAEEIPSALEAARRLIAAFAGGGCLDRKGEPLWATLLEPLAEAKADSSREDVLLQWLTLTMLEGMRCGSPEVQKLLTELVARPALDPALRLQALRTSVAMAGMGEGSGQVPDVLALLKEWGAESSQRQSNWRVTGTLEKVEPATGFARLLFAYGVQPPGDRSLLSGRTEALGPSLFAFAWSLTAAEEERAATLLVAVLQSASDESALLARGEELAEILAQVVDRGQAAGVRRVLSLARQQASTLASSVDRIALLADVMGDGDRIALAGGANQNDLALLGALGGTPGIGLASKRARTRLLELFGQALEAQRTPSQVAPLLRAQERVLEGLFRGPTVANSGGEAHADSLRRLQHQRMRSSLSERLRQRGWPLPPRLMPREPAADERVPPTRLLSSKTD